MENYLQSFLRPKKYATVRKSLCYRKKHQKVLANGVPEDAIVGVRNFDEKLPGFYFGGMRNIQNGSVELFFKLDDDELLLKTEKYVAVIQISTIENVFFEPIVGHEEYYMMCLQLDVSRHSKFWIYWVPRQFRKSIEDVIIDNFF